MSRVATYWLAHIIVLTSRNSFKSIWTYHSNTVTSYFYTIWAWAYPSVELVQNRGSPQRSLLLLHSWHKYPHSPFNSYPLIQVQNSFQIQQIQFQCPKVRFHCTWEHRLIISDCHLHIPTVRIFTANSCGLIRHVTSLPTGSHVPTI